MLPNAVAGTVHCGDLQPDLPSELEQNRHGLFGDDTGPVEVDVMTS